MRVSRLYKAQEQPEADRVPWTRTLIWSALALVVIAGLVLYFKYGPTISALL